MLTAPTCVSSTADDPGAPKFAALVRLLHKNFAPAAHSNSDKAPTSNAGAYTFFDIITTLPDVSASAPISSLTSSIPIHENWLDSANSTTKFPTNPASTALAALNNVATLNTPANFFLLIPIASASVITHDSKFVNNNEYAIPPSIRLAISVVIALDRSNKQLAAYSVPYATTSARCPRVSPSAAHVVPIVALTTYPSTYMYPISRFTSPCRR
mmetsp:Transcript_4739/g.18144  ORF Transcript_4739/g.18144 Transcript_4739/m.18144 type:complete len:213 (-) Transcript_4739:232-870(-)